MTWLPMLFFVVALLAVLFSNGFLTGVYLLARRPTGAKAPAPRPDSPPVVVIRPLRGLEPGADAANRSLLHQTYAGQLRVLFASTSADDPGLALARARHGDDPRVSCIRTREVPGALSDKASNMIAGWHATTAPFVAFCDADITLAPDMLRRCMARFDAPEVGGVFAPVLHEGQHLAGRLSMQLSAGDKLAITRAYDRFGALNFMEGGWMILRREAVDRAGGIEVVAGALADDLRLAKVLREHGFSLRAGPPIRHPMQASGLAAWARQYHRWMVCQRAENPGLIWPQILFHPLLLPLIACWTAPWTLLLGSAAWRVGLSMAADHLLMRPHGVRFGWWAAARPLADLLHVSACVAAYLLPTVIWGNRRYRLGRGGQVTEVMDRVREAASRRALMDEKKV